MHTHGYPLFFVAARGAMRAEEQLGEYVARIYGKSVARTALLPSTAWGARLAVLRAQRCALHP